MRTKEEGGRERERDLPVALYFVAKLVRGRGGWQSLSFTRVRSKDTRSDIRERRRTATAALFVLVIILWSATTCPRSDQATVCRRGCVWVLGVAVCLSCTRSCCDQALSSSLCAYFSSLLALLFLFLFPALTRFPPRTFPFFFFFLAVKKVRCGGPSPGHNPREV